MGETRAAVSMGACCLPPKGASKGSPLFVSLCWICPGILLFYFQVKGRSPSSPNQPQLESSLVAPLTSTFHNASQRQSWGGTGRLLNDAAQAPCRRGHKTINSTFSSAVLPNRVPHACQRNTVRAMNTHLAKTTDSQVSSPPVSLSSH